MKGLIFIPDISGFTNFVKSIELDLGATITTDLINVIIDNNPLKMEISEIEGDAILYYKIGKPIPLQDVLNGFRQMSDTFDLTFLKWKDKYKFDATLSLKLIVHYGNIVVYNIKGYKKKLYGETVIESHNLLKNGSVGNDYVLITEDYIEALPGYDASIRALSRDYKSYKSHFSTGMKSISYYYYANTKKASDISNFSPVSSWAFNDHLNMAVSI